ncbi:hypothetical protein ACOSQ2_012844 [Xanthoceras sorbifolium]
MATLHAIIFLLLLNSFSFTTTTMASTTEQRRLVTRLLHRDSLLLHNNANNDKTTVAATRAERLLNSSIARIIYLSEKTTSETHLLRDNNNAQPSLFLGTEAHLFYVNFSIGQPPVPQLAIMDTGSELIWVNCNHHSCHNCGLKVFDPSKSSTFAKTPCDDTIKYVKGTGSEGIIATEEFSFETSDEGRTTINNVVFGCGLKNGNFMDKSTGVFGLSVVSGKDNLSIVKLLGSRFSYCVGNIIDHEYKFNRLVLGEGAVMEGDSTPFEIRDGVYYLILEGISIGEKRLNIEPEIFDRTSNDDGVFIDSGSTFTFLALAAYQEVRREIENLSKGLLKRYWWVPSGHLCYYGKISRDLEGFPVMTFHFADGADLVLDIWSMFIQDWSDMFCLAIAPSEVSGSRRIDRSVIGMIAQQNYNVAYDLGENRLYFQRIDCELLDD